MSVERYFYWLCDVCGRVGLNHTYGFPEGFRVVHVRDGVHAKTEHRCETCLDEIAEITSEEVKETP